MASNAEGARGRKAVNMQGWQGVHGTPGHDSAARQGDRGNGREEDRARRMNLTWTDRVTVQGRMRHAADEEEVEGNVRTVARLACQALAYDARLFTVMRSWRVAWERAQSTARAAGFLQAQCDLEQVCQSDSIRHVGGKRTHVTPRPFRKCACAHAIGTSARTHCDTHTYMKQA